MNKFKAPWSYSPGYPGLCRSADHKWSSTRCDMLWLWSTPNGSVPDTNDLITTADVMQKQGIWDNDVTRIRCHRGLSFTTTPMSFSPPHANFELANTGLRYRVLLRALAYSGRWGKYCAPVWSFTLPDCQCRISDTMELYTPFNYDLSMCNPLHVQHD